MAAPVEALCLIKGEGDEPFDAGLAQVDLLVQIDTLGLLALDLEVDGIAFRRLLAGKFKELAPRYTGHGRFEEVLVMARAMERLGRCGAERRRDQCGAAGQDGLLRGTIGKGWKTARNAARRQRGGSDGTRDEDC